MTARGGGDHGLGAVRERFEAVAAGSASVVIVTGEPGTGRSHVLCRLAALAARSGLRTAEIRAAVPDSQVPYAVVGALGEEFGAKVTATGRTDPEDIAVAATRLVEAIGAGEDSRGTCLLVDDAGWADEASLRVLLYAVRRLRDRPLAIVIAAGPDSVDERTAPLLDELQALPDAILVQTGQLPAAEAAALIEARLPGWEPDLLDPLLARTGGNPFLLNALLDELADNSDAGEEFDAERIRSMVPDRVRAAVSARLTRSGPDAVVLAHAVHVLGEHATLSRAAALSGLDRRTAEDAADSLTRVGVLRPGGTVGFAQPLVGDAVGRTIKPFALDRLHRRTAELLTGEHATASHVARHLLQTSPSNEPWIVEQLRAAAALAVAEGDCATAAGQLRRALEEPPGEGCRDGLLAELAFAESRAGLPTAAQTLELALATACPPETRVMLLRERTRLMWLTGRLPEAVVASETALAESDPGTELHDQLLAELLAVASMHDLAPIYARPRLVDLLDRANTGWVPDSAPLAATLATVLPFVLGDHRLVGPLVDRAMREDLWRVEAPPFGMRPDFVIGSLWLSGGLERGTAIVRQGMATVDPANLFRHGLLHYWLGEIRYAAGDLTGTLEAATAALEPRWGPFLSWFGFSSATLAHTYLDLDDRRRAEEALARTEGQLDEHQLYGIAADLAWARLRLRAEQPAEAARLADSVADRLHALGHRDSPQIVWRGIAAAAAIAEGELDRARLLIEEELGFAERTHASIRIGRALRLQARITGRPDRAALLHRSAETLAASEHRLEHARALLDLGVELHDTGDVPAARAALAEARELAEECGAPPIANRALNALHATGARPRRTARSGVDSLTGTERRVVELAAAGRTNREIGEILAIARRTVEWHLRGAYAKLGVSSRRDLTLVLERRD